MDELLKVGGMTDSKNAFDKPINHKNDEITHEEVMKHLKNETSEDSSFDDLEVKEVQDGAPIDKNSEIMVEHEEPEGGDWGDEDDDEGFEMGNEEEEKTTENEEKV